MVELPLILLLFLHLWEDELFSALKGNKNSKLKRQYGCIKLSLFYLSLNIYFKNNLLHYRIYQMLRQVLSGYQMEIIFQSFGYLFYSHLI